MGFTWTSPTSQGVQWQVTFPGAAVLLAACEPTLGAELVQHGSLHDRRIALALASWWRWLHEDAKDVVRKFSPEQLCRMAPLVWRNMCASQHPWYVAAVQAVKDLR